MAHRAFNAVFARGVGAVLQRSKPDLVISTYPFLTYEVTQAMRRTRLHIPFAMQFADPNGVHVSWLTESNAEAAFAPTHETYNQATAAGFSAERLHLTGWPVRAQFYQQPATIRQQVCQLLNLEPGRFTIFLQGGGEGAAKFIHTTENLLALDNIQIILATGTNQMIFQRFQGIANLRPIPFTKEIAPYMAAADVVMGKAGPNMLFESTTLGRPFIATTYIPGQEEVNLEFITRHRLGWVALNAQEQRNLLTGLINEQAKLPEMAATVASYRQWNTTATEKILPLTQSLIESRRLTR